MNIKRALRIAQEQPWFNSFKKNVISAYGNFDEFLKMFTKDMSINSFFEEAFCWNVTKEGTSFWIGVMDDFRKIYCDDFVKKYYDRSVKIFVKEACGKEPVAKLINAAIDDEQRFVSVLKDTGICYDSVDREGKDIVAYKNIYKIEEEWI